MSQIVQTLLRGTSKSLDQAAMLVLEDGSVYRGFSCGMPGEVFGEICFNTSMEGYLEVISDPSYAGQIVTMCYPQQGNYGVNLQDAQSFKPAACGMVVRDLCATPSNWRSTMSLGAYLRDEGVVAIEGIDTRALVRHVRQAGAQRAVLSSRCQDEQALLAKVRMSESLLGKNLVSSVSCATPFKLDRSQLPSCGAFARREEAPAVPFRVVVYDCGVKRSILYNLVQAGCELLVVPWNTPASRVLAEKPDGVFLSNGPGDPEAVQATYTQVEKLLGKVPLFGICLGHQMISKAAKASVEKLKFGHRGANHPVMNLLSARVEITAQNHGFGLIFSSLGPLIPEYCGGQTHHVNDLRAWVSKGISPVVNNESFGRIRLTHVNLNDGTAEGIAFLDIPAFSVQYHPEASPGPTDAHYLFTAFAHLMQGSRDYLNIDIAADRLKGWVFGVRANEKDAAAGLTEADASHPSGEFFASLSGEKGEDHHA